MAILGQERVADRRTLAPDKRVARNERLAWFPGMVASLLLGEASPPEFGELLRPEPLPDGTEPEERLILCGVSWQRYLDLDKALGDDAAGTQTGGRRARRIVVSG
jgi:hypothetical protein